MFLEWSSLSKNMCALWI
ncbi:hypothetical protein F383_31341 [Gossypium arboreum]|uniref:Uncharacterized protein n=1 Tax=Gossypium arboreum TaxID=29729 RepID=A0A0B0PLY6_GOSAR|nr:hypothetical protein F383_31341 [Gossypium arboreum]